MVSVTQDPNVLKAEIGAKCRGTPRWLVTDPVKRTAKRTWAPFIQGRGVSCLGRVWPHSLVCSREVLFTIFTTRRKPSTAHDVTYRKKNHASFHITWWRQDEVTCLSNTVWLKINSLETKHQQLSGRPGVGFFSVATRSSGNSDRLPASRAARVSLWQAASVSKCQWEIRPLASHWSWLSGSLNRLAGAGGGLSVKVAWLPSTSDIAACRRPGQLPTHWLHWAHTRTRGTQSAGSQCP